MLDGWNEEGDGKCKEDQVLTGDRSNLMPTRVVSQGLAMEFLSRNIGSARKWSPWQRMERIYNSSCKKSKIMSSVSLP
jgi:hypothetical protein